MPHTVNDKKIIIHIQNISDVITNSSSEIFICKSDNAEHTIELLEEVLSSVYENYKKARDHAGSNTYSYYGDSLSDILTMYIANNDEYNSDYNYHIKRGDIIIESTDDNSIPSIIMDFIHEFFKWDKSRTFRIVKRLRLEYNLNFILKFLLKFSKKFVY